MNGSNLTPQEARLVVASARASNEQVLGSVVDDSVKRSAEARAQREAREAERRAEESRQRRAEEFARAEEQEARALEEKRRAAEAEAQRKAAERDAWLNRRPAPFPGELDVAG